MQTEIVELESKIQKVMLQDKKLQTMMSFRRKKSLYCKGKSPTKIDNSYHENRLRSTDFYMATRPTWNACHRKLKNGSMITEMTNEQMKEGIGQKNEVIT